MFEHHPTKPCASPTRPNKHPDSAISTPSQTAASAPPSPGSILPPLVTGMTPVSPASSGASTNATSAPALSFACSMQFNGLMPWTCAEALPAGISRSAEAANPVQTASRNFDITPPLELDLSGAQATPPATGSPQPDTELFGSSAATVCESQKEPCVHVFPGSTVSTQQRRLWTLFRQPDQVGGLDGLTWLPGPTDSSTCCLEDGG